MSKEKPSIKICKHCQTEIPYVAKVCPQCRKKQKGGVLKWVIIAILVIVVIGAVAGSGDDDEPIAKKTGEVETEGNKDDSKKESDSEEKEVSNIFNAGDVVETEDLKITFLSTGQYQEENEFLEPKEGFEYWKFEFQFENISDSDQSVSSMIDWTCYADNAKVDQSWIGDDNGLDATLSPGRTTQGTIFFEVPVEAEKIELEYEISFWKSDKIIFIGK